MSRRVADQCRLRRRCRLRSAATRDFAGDGCSRSRVPGAVLPAYAWYVHVPLVTRRHPCLPFFLVAGLAVMACRAKRRSGLGAEDIAGRWVIDYIEYTGVGQVPQYLGTEPHDTLTIFADGRWWSRRDSTRYTMRHDSLVLPADTGEAAYFIRFVGPGEPRLGLSRRAVYDFNADGLPEWAVQETVLRRVHPGGPPTSAR